MAPGAGITPNEAALAMSCNLCHEPMQAAAKRGKTWRFRCAPCGLVIRPDDIGTFQQAIVRRAGMLAAQQDLDQAWRA
jgi:hypothetical protein